MDDEDFEDLFSESFHLLQPSLQGSLIGTATNPEIEHEHGVGNAYHPRWDDDDRFSEGEHDPLPINTGSFAQDVLHNDFRPVERMLPRAYPNATIIDKIEAVLEGIIDAMLHDKLEISITLKARPRTGGTNSNADLSDASTRRLCFPGQTADEAWRFSVVLRLMELVHEALRNDVVLSKRDIFYRDPALFGSQAYVDRYIDDIAYTFGISRSMLNVCAAAKGLFAGAITFIRTDGSTTDASSNQEGILVANLKDILSADLTAVKWVLVIEKEATFRSIAGSDFWNKIISEGIIVTGKGYPDFATRALLHYISTPCTQNGFASPPIYGLADFDPDGIAILSTYKHGSKALAHENKDHAVPQLQWLGLRSEHLHAHEHDTHATQGLLTLTKRDRSKAAMMLNRREDRNDEDAALQRRELQVMLMLNTKAELQLLDATRSGMNDLLDSMLVETDNPREPCQQH